MRKHPRNPKLCPLTGRFLSRTLEEKFWEKIEKTDECWLWTGCKTRNGYGTLKEQNIKHHLTHRLSWELNVGPIPEGVVVCHKCDVRNCVNPNHLFLGTQADNMRDMDAKQRRVTTPSRYEKNGSAKLNQDQVRDIRYLRKSTNLTVQQIADKFSVSKPLIEKILANKLWVGI